MTRRPQDTLQNAVSGLAFVMTLAVLLKVNPVQPPEESRTASILPERATVGLATARHAFALGYYLTACPSAGRRMQPALGTAIGALADTLSLPDSVLSGSRYGALDSCPSEDEGALAGRALDRGMEGFFLLGELIELDAESRRTGGKELTDRIDNEINKVVQQLYLLNLPHGLNLFPAFRSRGNRLDVDELYRSVFRTSQNLTLRAPPDHGRTFR